jgi:hypothetical protein
VSQWALGVAKGEISVNIIFLKMKNRENLAV